MKKILFIAILIMTFSLLLAGGVPTPRTGLIHSQSWSDGAQSVYLYRGNYHFSSSGYVTCNPFVFGNLYIHAGVVSGEENWCAYGEATSAVTNYYVYDSSDQFTIDTSGYYNVQVGAYAHYGCTISNDTGYLYCDYTPVIVNDD
jgi:hypothetical protein